MNYTTLTELIKRYCENEEASFVANIPNFVKLAEQRIFDAVPLQAARKNSVGVFTQDNGYLTLPTDWLATHSVAVILDSGTYEYLVNKDPEFIRESFPAPTATGVPAYYAQFDKDTLLVGPTPNAAYGVELHYYAYPTSIVDAGTTWLGDNFDSVLLYGALREAYLYMKGEADIVAQYEQKYQESLQLLKGMADTRVHRDDYRNIRQVI